MKLSQTFTVIYRTGGTAVCEWKKCLPLLTRDEANKQKSEIEKMGFKAIIHKTDELNQIGMPEGWAA